MAWGAPPDFQIGDTPTHTEVNQVLANLEALRHLHDAAVRVFRTADLTVGSSGTRTMVTWQDDAWQRGALWTAGANGSKLFAPLDGIYLHGAQAEWASNNSGIRGIGARINGSGSDFDQQFQSAQTGTPRTNSAEIFLMNAGDYLETYVYQSSGGSLDLQGGTVADSWATLRLLGTETSTPFWTDPRTWATGDRLYSWRLWTEWNDNLNALRYLGGQVAKVSLLENVSISPGERSPISWTVPLIQVGEVWDSGADFVAQHDGWYMLLIHLEWRNEAAGNIGAKRGCGYKIADPGESDFRSTNYDLQFQSGSQSGVRTNGKARIRLRAGERVGVYGLHDADQSLTINGGAPDRSRCSMHFHAAW